MCVSAISLRKPLLILLPNLECRESKSNFFFKSESVGEWISGFKNLRLALVHITISPCRYDIRCVYIPSNDRSTWDELVDTLVPLIEQAASLSESGASSRFPTTTLLQYAHGAKQGGEEEVRSSSSLDADMACRVDIILLPKI
jgi:hypothetical protein